MHQIPGREELVVDQVVLMRPVAPSSTPVQVEAVVGSCGSQRITSPMLVESLPMVGMVPQLQRLAQLLLVVVAVVAVVLSASSLRPTLELEPCKQLVVTVVLVLDQAEQLEHQDLSDLLSLSF